MSNFEKGDWYKIWDALYWRFIFKRKKVFEKNPKISMKIIKLNKIKKEKLKKHLMIAEKFLKKLDKND